MTKVRVITATGAIIAFGLSTFGATAAQASELTSPQKADNTSNIIKKENVDSQKASLTIKDSEKSQTFDETEAITVAEELKEHGLSVDDYKKSDGSKINSLESVNVGESLTLFKDETNSVSETFSIPAPEQRVNTDDLYVGEEKVDSPGKDGTAIRTVVSKNDLSVNEKVNPDANAVDKNNLSKGLSSSQEKITILEAPETRIILVGTKVRPTPHSSTTSYSSPTGSRGSGSYVSPVTAEQIPEAANNALVQLALAQVGKSYVWGATGPNAFDCSGLVYWIFSVNGGKSLPRTAASQGMASTPISYDQLKPGDILWTATHIAIYAGNGQVVHAANPNKGVIITPLSYFQGAGFKAGRL